MHVHAGATVARRGEITLRPARPAAARARLLSILAACLLLGHTALAQGHGGMGRGGYGGGFGGSEFRDHTAPAMGSAGMAPKADARAGGLHLAPGGRWWDDDRFVQTLGLNASQQKRMDTVFASNRESLLHLYRDLDHELGQLDKLGRARNLDEAEIFAQIDRVNQARSELEKGMAHMQLELRKEMTSEQTAKMDDLRMAAAPAPAAPTDQPAPPQP